MLTKMYNCIKSAGSIRFILFIYLSGAFALSDSNVFAGAIPGSLSVIGKPELPDPFSPLVLNPSGNLDQARNGSASGPNSPVQFVNGNAGSANSHYLESMSIPYRVVLTDLAPGQHYFELEFDNRQSGINALDFITHYNRLEPHAQFNHPAEIIDPLVGLSGVSNIPVTFPIPAPIVNKVVACTGLSQPVTEFNSLPAAERAMTMFNGLSIDSVKYVLNGSGNYGDLNANSSTVRMRIVFTTSNATVVFAWGGHIADGDVWCPGNSASGISGSPYHTRLSSVDGSSGGQDRSLSASAVIPVPPCDIIGSDLNCAGTTVTYSKSAFIGYTYTWSITSNTSGASISGSNTGSSVNINSGNQAGTYTIQLIMSGPGYTGTCTKVVQVSKINLSTTTSSFSCSASAGSVNLTVTGGSSPYTYVWSNGATTEDISGLNSGSYSVTVTGYQGCTAATSATVQANTPMSVTLSKSDASCFGAANGSISMSLSGGTAPFVYNWNNGAISQNISGITAGTYTVSVTDNKGCSITASTTVSQPQSPISIALTSSQNISCYGGANGSINITVTGGTAPYTYNWNTGAASQDLNSISAGSYAVTVTDANGCTSNFNHTITQPTGALSASYSSIQHVSCYGSATGAIDLSVSGGTPPYSYLWNNGQTTQDVSVLTAGNYSVTITDSQGCTAVKSSQINQPAAELSVAVSSSIQVSCFGGNNGSISLQVSGGTGPYSFQWNNGAISQNVNNLISGNYSVTVTDAAGCTGQLSVSIQQPSSSLNGTVTQSQAVSCFAGNNGALFVQASGGTAPYSYFWNTGSTVQNPSSLNAGNYTVTITDAKGCLFSAQGTVTQPQASLSASLSQTQSVSCFGNSDGMVALTVSGGTPAYSYNWSTGATSQNLNGLAAGNYTVTVIDANGCTRSGSIAVTQPGAALAAAASVVSNVSCFGGANGSASVSISGGTLPYSILWSSGSTSQSVTGLSSGNYSVTVTDARGCSVISNCTVSQPAAALSVSVSASGNVTCFGNGNGFINTSVSGGTAPYVYNWNNSQTTSSVSGLAPGTYSVSVTDNKGCVANTSAVISQPSAALSLSTTITSNISCFSGNNGAIDLSLSGGTAPYSYLWSTGATTQDVANLPAGGYQVTVTDANGCTAVSNATISQPAGALSTNISISQQVSCFGGNNGSVDLTVSGGTQPYTYSWSNGSVSQDLSGLSSGVYTVTIYDSNGCNATQSATVSQPSAALAASVSSITDISCFGDNSGAILLSVSGGTAPYSFLWSNGATSQNINGVAMGNYSVSVIDLNGCTAGTAGVISQPSAALSVAINASVNVSCFGGNNGSVNIGVSGGTSPYTYLWNDGATSEDRNGLSAGLYTVTVTDAKGCLTQQSVTISQPVAALSASLAITQNVSCFGGSNGAVTLAVNGGTAPYNYAWSNGATTQNLAGVGSGNYSVTVTDNKGCQVIKNGTITQPSAALSTAASVTQQVSCFGGSNGTIHLSVSGGTAPYAYNWNTGNISQDLSGLSAGTYNVTVSDANGCSALAAVTVNQPAAALSVTASGTTMVSCRNGSDASINTIVGGGTQPYSYNWSNGSTTQNISGLIAGNYTILVTDVNGCSSSAIVNITQPAASLSASATVSQQVSCFGGANGSILLTPSGGTAPYTYLWSNGTGSQNISNLQSGSYSVTVTDAKGCTASAGASVNQPAAALSAVIAVDQDVLCFGAQTGSLQVNASGGTTPYVYSWNTGASSQSVSGLAAGNYSVTVTDNNGCTSIAISAISQPSAPLNSSIAASGDVSCFGAGNGFVTLNVNGGTSPYLFNWSNGATSQNLNGVVSGTYSVTVTDGNGCVTTNSALIHQPSAALSAAVSVQQAVSCTGGSNGSISINVNGGTAPYSYNWISGSTAQNLVNLQAGNYAVTITDNNGCTFSLATNVTEPLAVVSISAASVQPVLCYAGNSGSIDVSVSGGTQPYTYLWSNGATSQDIYSLSVGVYSVVVTDANGCTAAFTQSVSQPAAALASSTTVTSNISCFSGNNGAVDLTVSGGTAPYLFSWNTGAVSEDISGQAAGSYSVTITDANGCTDIAYATITQPAGALSLAVSVTQNVSCNGGSNGMVNASVNGGTAPYNYMWSNGATGVNINSLSAGIYTVTVTDVNGCNTSQTANVTQPAMALNAVVNAVQPVLCNSGNSGFIDLYVIGGTLPYTYLWSNGVTTEDITNITSGTYTATITDANGCTVSITQSVSEPAQPLSASAVAVTPVSCFGGNNGAVNLSAAGGTAPYVFEWSNGAITEDVSGLSAGTYSVTVTDVNGCAASVSVNISQPAAALSAVASASQQVFCFGGSNGSATVVAAGGTLPYTYSWSNGAAGNAAGSLSAGTYTVTVTDSNGCSSLASVQITQPAASLSGTISQVSPALCYGGSTGSVSVQISGGTVPYSYNWNTGATTQNINNLSAGNYSVIVTDYNGCTFSLNQTVTQPAAALAASALQSQFVNCYGGNNGTVSVNATGGTVPYSYQWNTGDNTQSVSGLTAANYSVTVTDSNGCSALASVQVTQPSAVLSAVATAQQQVSCFNGTNGSVLVVAAGGTQPYSYNWSNGATTSGVSGLPAAQYNVTITDANGCIAAAQLTVQQPAAAVTATITAVQPVSCFGGANGSISVNVSGGTPAYTYLWNTGTGSQNLTGLISGTYAVTVTDVQGCSAMVSASVGQPNAPISATTVVTSNISCYSGNNGSIDLSVTGGTSPYSYLWSTGSTSEDINSISAGSYQVTVTDANGCTFIASEQITQPAGALSAGITSPQAVSCFGGANGSLQLSVNGGTLPYSYVWNTGATSQNISGLNTGTYTVTITDANGCNVSQSGLVSQPAAPITISVTSVDPVLCNAGNTGAIAVSVSGGTTPYTYSWTNGFTGVSNTGLTAGSYGVVVVDQNGCSDSTVILVSEPVSALSATVNSNTPVSCYGGNNGALDVTVAGGTAPYTYMWSNGSASEDLSGLSSGNYQLTITDANGCDFNLNAVISQPAAPISATPVVTQQVQCFAGEDGIIDLTVSGGTGPYTYQWSNGSTDEDLSQLMAGVYTVTVTDINGCMVVAAEEVFEPVLPLTGTPTVVSNVFCNGGSNGAIDLSVTGGTAPYTYIWSTGDTTEDVSNLAVGTYSVTITDAHGCSTIVSAGIGQPAQQLNASLLIQHVLCYNGTNGTIDVTAAGGTAPYSYQWSTGATTEDIGSLTAGTYTVVITDVNGCTVGLNAIVNQPQSPLIPVVSVDQDVSCYGGSDGALNVAASGGTPPYVYLWSSGTTTAGAINLPAGMYTVTVTDANGCNAIISQNVSQPLAPVNAVLTVGHNVSCHGGDNGMVSAAAAGGTSPYTFLWSTGATTSAISGLSAGTYTVTVTDIKGCEFSTSAIVTEPAAPVSISGSTTVANCLYGIGGTATAGAIGGTPPYSYQWSNGASGPSIANAAPGSYTVIVTDANGCTASVGLIVGNESPVTVNPGPTTICVGQSTTLSVDSIAGSAYQWYYAGVALNGAVNNTFQTQAQGYYYVVVSSACGTFYSDSVSVTVNSVTNASINNNLMICPPETAQLNATGGTSYQWTPEAGLNFSNIPNPVASPTQSTVYSVVVTNDYGCSITLSVEVIIDCDTLFVPNGFSPNNDGVNDGYVIDGILNYPNNKFWVYNRWGNLVYKTNGYANQWNGECNVQGIYWGTKVPAGTYFYILDLGDNSEKPRSGYLIIRY
ncbi:MAG TPA: gliding motility-associated C-terminal domain-containing protein [Bacteroidia bacterium]|nr:gliding motility-associated C-terminal domain-containing protein [Bacteroidia bacterium]